MKIKVFCVPLPGGEVQNAEMNTFLNSNKIIQIESQVISNPRTAFWCYSVQYLDDIVQSDREKTKVDYRQVLDDATFKRFSALRDIRRALAKTDEVPAYVIFTDEELAEMAKMGRISVAAMKSIKGVGEKKIEKYAQYFISDNPDEKSESLT